MEVKIGGKYKITRKIGEDSFSQLFLGLNTQNGEEIAIKLEAAQKTSQLQWEIKVLRIVQEGTGIPKLLWHSTESEFNILVMELLGPSLETLLNYCKHTFTLKTVLMLADQIISRVEFMHSYSYVHRDIKPENFAVGIGKKANIVFLTGFGYGKKYLERYNVHIPYREGKNLTGTARYVSLNTHLGIEQSRRDDLESIGYMMVYWLKGNLPWQGLPGTNKQEKYRNILDKKASMTIEEICSDLPNEFGIYLNYCRSLRFEEKPDYSFLRRIFRELLARENLNNDLLFDWYLPRNRDSPRPKKVTKVKT